MQLSNTRPLAEADMKTIGMTLDDMPIQPLPLEDEQVEQGIPTGDANNPDHWGPLMRELREAIRHHSARLVAAGEDADATDVLGLLNAVTQYTNFWVQLRLAE